MTTTEDNPRDLAEIAEVASGAPNALALIKTAAMAELVTLNDGLADLQTKYRNVVYPVATPAGMEEAKAARDAIQAPRYKVPHIIKAKKAELKQIGEDIEAYGGEFVAACLLLELPIKEQIRAQEQLEEDARLERKRKAEEFDAATQKAIDGMRGALTEAVGKTASDIQVLIDRVGAVVVTAEAFGKRAGEAKQTQMQIGESLRVLRDAAVAAEEKLAELNSLRAAAAARDQAEEERLQTEQKAAADAAKAQRLKEKEAADRAAAAQRQTQFALEQITAVQALIGDATADGTVEGISSFLATVVGWEPDDTYGLLQSSAVLARTTAITQLETLLANVKQAAIDAQAAADEADRVARAEQAERDQAAEAARQEKATADANASRDRLAAKLALQKAQSVAAELLAALRGVDAALEAFTLGDSELACIPDCAEKTDLSAAWDTVRAAITAGT